MKRQNKGSIGEVVALCQGKERPEHLPAGAPQKHGARILHADDDDAVRKVCRHVLTREGYSVVSAANGIEAWHAVEKQDFDLIITNHQMPRCTGYELLSKLRHEHIHWPVIVTASDVDAFRGHASEWLDVSAVLEKPFGMRELAATISRLVSGAGIPVKTNRSYEPRS